jgi:hypothetical protein
MDGMTTVGWNADLVVLVAWILIIVTTSFTTTVKLDAISTASDSVAFARADRAGNWRWGRSTRDRWATRAETWAVALGIRVNVGLLVELGKAGSLKLGGEFGKSSSLELAGKVTWADWLWRSDLGSWLTAWELARVAARRSLGVLGGGLLLGSIRGWNIEDVEFSASGWLDGEILGWIVRNSIAVEHVVEPVSLTSLHNGGGEAESTLPLWSFLGEWELTTVRVPGTNKVDLLDIRSSAEWEGKFDSGHCNNL